MLITVKGGRFHYFVPVLSPKIKNKPENLVLPLIKSRKNTGFAGTKKDAARISHRNTAGNTGSFS